MRKLSLRFLALCGLLVTVIDVGAQQIVKIAYISQELVAPTKLSNLDPFIQDRGERGAELAIADNNTTGQFTNQVYQLDKIIAPPDADVVQMFQEKVVGRYSFVVVNLPTEVLLRLADIADEQSLLLLDAATIDDSLRNERCHVNVLHLLPSRAMRADALAQYMMHKRWTRWFLVVGATAEDRLFANALKRATQRFNMEIVAEKVWEHTFDNRRQEQAEIPVFTQGVDYDILVVADEQGLFGEYIDYRTWLPRPVMGTQGLIATAWHPTHEAWGAVQMQNRFLQAVGRFMTEIDYGAYLAVRAIGEAATRTKSNQLQAIKPYLLSEQLALQGYKGSPLSFRAWNGQLRQPVLLAAPRSMVAVAPITGFLHPKTELDTLGYDLPESKCK